MLFLGIYTYYHYIQSEVESKETKTKDTHLLPFDKPSSSERASKAACAHAAATLGPTAEVKNATWRMYTASQNHINRYARIKCGM